MPISACERTRHGKKRARERERGREIPLLEILLLNHCDSLVNIMSLPLRHPLPTVCDGIAHVCLRLCLRLRLGLGRVYTIR